MLAMIDIEYGAHADPYPALTGLDRGTMEKKA